MNGKLEQKNGYASGPVTLIVESPEAFKEVAHHFGALIPPHVAAKMAEVTNQRIQNLIRQGRFTRIVIYGAVNDRNHDQQLDQSKSVTAVWVHRIDQSR